MKNKWILKAVFGLALLMTGCKVGNVASHQGLTDQAYLYFASSNKYEEPVIVSVDEEATFEAQVVKEKKSTIKGFTYAIRTGKRHVSISHKGQVLYDPYRVVAPKKQKNIIAMRKLLIFNFTQLHTRTIVYNYHHTLQLGCIT